MEMRKCVKGHYYDSSIYSECPYCNNNQGANVTLPLQSVMGNQGNEDSKTLPLGYQSAVQLQATAPSAQQAVQEPEDDGRTIAIIHKDMGIDPVVGWLVCTSGKEKGRDYRIHTDNNFIGRSEKMDICIRGDETVSRENHAVISYDSVEKTYYFSPGDGRSIVRLNNKAIFQTTEIKAYDRITIGKTILLFIPLCSAEFDWEKEEG